jgi:hypothetical protein
MTSSHFITYTVSLQIEGRKQSVDLEDDVTRPGSHYGVLRGHNRFVLMNIHEALHRNGISDSNSAPCLIAPHDRYPVGDLFYTGIQKRGQMFWPDLAQNISMSGSE